MGQINTGDLNATKNAMKLNGYKAKSWINVGIASSKTIGKPAQCV